MGRCHTLGRWIKTRRGILVSEVAPEERGAQDVRQAPQPRVSVPEREIPITSGCKNQWGLRLSDNEGYWSPRHSSYRARAGACRGLLGLAPSALLGQPLKRHQGHTGRN